MKPVLTVKDLSYSYLKGQEVISHANFEVNEKEFVGIIGPNGGGKTTLLKLLLGLLKSNQGEIKILDTTPKKAASQIGYVPQFTHFDKNFPITVREMVLLGCLTPRSFFGRYSAQEIKKANTVLERFQLGKYANRSIGSLSGGQLQKTLIARALVSNPRILAMDEPTSSFDTHGGEGVFDLLRDLNKEITILIISHDVGFVSSYIDRAICVNRHLECHKTSELTAANLKKIFGQHVHAVDHST